MPRIFPLCLFLFALALAACTEASTPTTEPAATPTATLAIAQTCVDPAAFVTFVVNVHDTVHVDESAATILHLADIFERHGVHGDFYLTGPMVQLYSEQHPEVIDRLKSSGMTISYHVRPPHPLYAGFDSQLKRLSDSQLAQTLRDYETYGLDLRTGGLDRSRPGGYAAVAAALGTNPVTAAAPNGDQRIKDAALRNYAAMGAKMTILYHETGTKPEKPFEYVDGLLVRPSDFSITRWPMPGTTSKGDKDPFWWNFMSSPHAAEYNPAAKLQAEMANWEYGRPAFVTSLIHENNFYRSGAEAWTLSYFADTEKATPLSPPYDLNARDASKPRSQADQDAIWAAYEQLVATAAEQYRVVTSADIVALAAASPAGQVASACAVLGPK